MTLIRYEIPGAMEGDLRVDWAYVVNFWDHDHLKASWYFATQPPAWIRYPRIAEAGPRLAGQGQIRADPEAYAPTWEWTGDEWADRGPNSGTSPVIYDGGGTLQIIRPAPDQTSQGYRQLDADGRPVLADSQMVIDVAGRLLHEYTRLLAPDGAELLLGQDHDSGAHIVLAGVRYVLEPGDVHTIRARIAGSSVAVALSRFDRRSVVLYTFELADVPIDLPVFVAPGPIPPDPEPPDPTPEPPDPEPPDPGPEPPHPLPPEVPTMPIPDDQFQAMCKDVGLTAAPFMPHETAIEIEQGARQLGDQIRKPKSEGGVAERNPLAFELFNGAGVRSGIPGGMSPETVEQLVAALEPLNTKYGLWR